MNLFHIKTVNYEIIAIAIMISVIKLHSNVNCFLLHGKLKFENLIFLKKNFICDEFFL
jgi:hypothetical protein